MKDTFHAALAFANANPMAAVALGAFTVIGLALLLLLALIQKMN